MQKSGFQLIQHKLIKVDFVTNPELSIKVKECPISFTGRTKVFRTPGKNQADVFFDFRVSFENESEALFNIATSHMGTFVWDDTYTEAQLDGLLNVNAPAILLSFDRSVISFLTAYSGFPTLTVPLIDFTKGQDQNPEQDIELSKPTN